MAPRIVKRKRGSIHSKEKSSEKKKKNSLSSGSSCGGGGDIAQPVRKKAHDSCKSVHKKRKLNRSEMWNDNWDAIFLNILEGACAGNYPSSATSDNSLWRSTATNMQEALVDPRLIKYLTPDCCKERGKHFRKMYRASKAINDPSPLQEQLRRIYSVKRVPKFSRMSANPASLSSLMSRTMSRGSGSRSGSKSKSGAKHWKSDLIAALTNLVSFHNLNLQVADYICDKLDTEVKVRIFLGLDPDTQMREVKKMISPCAFMPVESPPSASTQLGSHSTL